MRRDVKFLCIIFVPHFSNEKEQKQQQQLAYFLCSFESFSSFKTNAAAVAMGDSRFVVCRRKKSEKISNSQPFIMVSIEEPRGR
jgi:hypothetical protein